MNINFTVVVQLLHFFIAYILIERLLLRPAAALIQKEDDERLKLQNLAAFNKERLGQKEIDKEREWRMVQELFLKTMPRARTLEAEQTKQVMIEPDKLDEHYVQQVIKKSTDFLVAKVTHD